MSQVELPDWVLENKVQIGFGLLGIALMGYGVWSAYDSRMAKDGVVEIISANEVGTMPKEIVRDLVVDVSGAVEKPGVYSLPAGSRVNDALMMAGGLAAEADRVYVSRNVNLAAMLEDGIKLYIPIKDVPYSDQLPMVRGTTTQSSQSERVSINQASESELDSLWGVGPARARSIIDNRPYSSVDELKTKAGIPANVIEANSDILGL